jgi:sarcosine oxidase subunit gamma
MVEPSLPLRRTNQPWSTARFTGADFQLEAEERLSILGVQLAGGEARAKVERRLDLELPGKGRCVEGQGIHCAWLGPDEWLLFGDEGDIRVVSKGLDADLKDELALVVDLTHGRATFIATGPAAAVRLSLGCPLDLRDASLRAGACARSLLGEAQMFLERLRDRDGAPAYRLVFDQTMADYALRLLLGAEAQ